MDRLSNIGEAIAATIAIAMLVVYSIAVVQLLQ